MKGLIIMFCSLLLTACSGEDEKLSKGIEQRVEIHAHMQRQLNVQKGRARVREAKLDDIILENR